MNSKRRIDDLLVENGFADSISKARSLIMAGLVIVGTRRIEKPSEVFTGAVDIRIKGDGEGKKFVGRGGLKLEAALAAFSVDAGGLACIDIGSSTGGFTDCLLKHGAESVVAIDAGTNQLVWELRIDPRVDVREHTNARYLKPSDFDRPFDLAVIDVSFISVIKIIEPVVRLLDPNGKLIVLIKPQFEVDKPDVGKGGIVRDPKLHEIVIQKVNEYAAALGLTPAGLITSPILGAEGNREFLALYDR